MELVHDRCVTCPIVSKRPDNEPKMALTCENAGQMLVEVAGIEPASGQFPDRCSVDVFPGQRGFLGCRS